MSFNIHVSLLLWFECPSETHVEGWSPGSPCEAVGPLRRVWVTRLHLVGISVAHVGLASWPESGDFSCSLAPRLLQRPGMAQGPHQKPSRGRHHALGLSASRTTSAKKLLPLVSHPAYGILL